mgnify:FL=1
MNDKDYITPKELAVRWHKSVRTLANQRIQGEGPPYYKIAGKILYDMQDIKEIEEKSFVGRTD